MEASQIYNDLINKIETSQLNYKISKTPFSANVSIKCSLIKYHFDKKDAPHSEIGNYSVKDEKLEAIKLSDDLKSVREEKEQLEYFLKQERSKVKSLEAELEEFRDKVLAIKKEKHSLNSNIKTYKTELDSMKGEKIKMEKIMDDLKDQLKVNNDVIKAKDIEFSDLKKDKIGLENQLDKCVTELESVKKEKMSENDNMKEVKCSHCNFKCESTVQLGQHVRSNHFKNQVSQTRTVNIHRELNFTEYSCYYCRKMIKSLHDLEEHKPVCYSIKDFAPFPCNVCGAQCQDEADLGMHRTTYHELGTFNEELGIDVFWCDVCPITCRSKSELDVHIRGCHAEF